MKNFGKLHMQPMSFPQLDLDGNLVNSITVLGFFDENEVEWHELYKTDPYAAYIAVDDDGRVVSAQQDYEQMQVAGLTIWGLDDYYGHVFGSVDGNGATCIGWYWVGDDIVEVSPNVELIDLSYNQFHAMLEILGKRDKFIEQMENLTPLIKKVMSKNVFFNPTTKFLYSTEVVALTAPLVWGDGWKNTIKDAWYVAKGY